MPRSFHVLCFGTDQRLLSTREAVLAEEYQTSQAHTLVSLLQLSLKSSYDLVVLCHTLRPEVYEQAVTLVHSCCPHAGIVALTKSGAQETPEGADRVFCSLDGPAALLRTVRSTLAEKQSSEL